MTRDEIIKQMGWFPNAGDAISDLVARVEAVVRKAEEAEREACAKLLILTIGRAVAVEREECAEVCENVWDSRTGLETGTALQCAEAIRKRGESK